MKKRLLISLLTAACFMYGCASSAPVSANPETTAETSESSDGREENEESKENAQEDTQPESLGKSAAEHKPEESSGQSESGSTDSTDSSDSETSTEESTEESLSVIGSQHIETVKNAHPENFPRCTYGQAFEEFFTSPEWKYFESTDGRDIVEFSGNCLYAGAQTKTRLQFVIDKTSSAVTTGAMSYNGAPQTSTVISTSIETIFKQYADKHGISYLSTQPLAPAESTAAAESAPGESLPGESAAGESNTANLANMENASTAAAPAVTQGTSQAALAFAAWSKPNQTSWYSPSTGYYVIPYIDQTGNASIAFTTAITEDPSGTVYTPAYYTDAVSAVANSAGGLTYQGYIYAAKETPEMIGMVEVTWSSAESISGLSVRMINGSQAMDTSMAASDYTYYRAP